MTKQCTRCRTTKPLSEFYLKTATSLRSRCKLCLSELQQEYFAKPGVLRHKREHSRKYTEENRLVVRKMKRASEVKRKPIKRVYDPYKRRARRQLQYAIVKGTITRPLACSECGWVCAPQAHHADYSKPLEVVWLCQVCHGKRHRKP